MWRYIVGCVVLATLAAAQVDPRCDGASIINGFGYLADLANCDRWIRCTFDDSNAAVKSEQQFCGCGMFWNQNVLTCFPARDVTCPSDQCAGGGVNSYAYPGNCRTYFTCEGGRTSGGVCCNVGQRYDAGSQSCVADASCVDDCLCVDKTTLTPPTCRFSPNSQDPNTYLEDDNGVQIVRPCPPGSSYNASACKCSIFVDTPQPDCPVDFDLQCDSDPLKDAANDVYIMNNAVGVDLNADTCLFNGSSSNLLIPRYADQDFRDAFAIYVAFNGGSNQNANGPLFSNSACATGEGPSSVNIRLTRFGVNNGPVVEVSVRIEGSNVIIRAPYRPNERNNIYASYNGLLLKLCVEHENGSASEAEEAVEGLTDRVQCSVKYGESGNDNFVGVIYETQVYVYCVPNPFCPQ